MLPRLVITFLSRSKYLLISWLQSPSAVILEPRKIKSDTVSTVSPSISHEVMGPDAMIFVWSVGAQYATGDQWRNNSRKIGLSDSLLLESYIASIPATAATLFMTPLGNDRDG